MPTPNVCSDCEKNLPKSVIGLCEQCKTEAHRQAEPIKLDIEKDTGLHDGDINEWWMDVVAENQE